MSMGAHSSPEGATPDLTFADHWLRNISAGREVPNELEDASTRRLSWLCEDAIEQLHAHELHEHALQRSIRTLLQRVTAEEKEIKIETRQLDNLDRTLQEWAAMLPQTLSSAKPRAGTSPISATVSANTSLASPSVDQVSPGPSWTLNVRPRRGNRSASHATEQKRVAEAAGAEASARVAEASAEQKRVADAEQKRAEAAKAVLEHEQERKRVAEAQKEAQEAEQARLREQVEQEKHLARSKERERLVQEAQQRADEAERLACEAKALEEARVSKAHEAEAAAEERKRLLDLDKHRRIAETRERLAREEAERRESRGVERSAGEAEKKRALEEDRLRRIAETRERLEREEAGRRGSSERVSALEQKQQSIREIRAQLELDEANRRTKLAQRQQQQPEERTTEEPAARPEPEVTRAPTALTPEARVNARRQKAKADEEAKQERVRVARQRIEQQDAERRAAMAQRGQPEVDRLVKEARERYQRERQEESMSPGESANTSPPVVEAGAKKSEASVRGEAAYERAKQRNAEWYDNMKKPEPKTTGVPRAASLPRDEPVVPPVRRDRIEELQRKLRAEHQQDLFDQAKQEADAKTDQLRKAAAAKEQERLRNQRHEIPERPATTNMFRNVPGSPMSPLLTADESRWAHFERIAVHGMIRLADVPFPRGSLCTNLLPETEFKKLALRWHPDKFQQRFGDKLCNQQREAILNQVKETFQTVQEKRVKQQMDPVLRSGVGSYRRHSAGFDLSDLYSERSTARASYKWH